METKYNKSALEEEIKKISLTEFQKQNVNNHFSTVESILKRMGFFNIQRQGSFGRGTVIQGQEDDGFDLDIAIVLDKTDNIESSQLNYRIADALRNHYFGKNVSVEKKAVKTEVKSNFQIDVTQICRDKVGQELVFNSHTMSFELSYALAFRNLFKERNSKSNNALRDLCKIYKHIRDSINDIETKSLALEIFLYKSFRTDISDYGNSLIKTLQNVDALIRKRIKDGNFNWIENPACIEDKIPTGIETKEEAKKFLKLNTVVIKAIEGTLVHKKTFHSLKRKYQSLNELDNSYNVTTIIQPNKTVVTSGVFGGDNLDWDI